MDSQHSSDEVDQDFPSQLDINERTATFSFCQSDELPPSINFEPKIDNDEDEEKCSRPTYADDETQLMENHTHSRSNQTQTLCNAFDPNVCFCCLLSVFFFYIHFFYQEQIRPQQALLWKQRMLKNGQVPTQIKWNCYLEKHRCANTTPVDRVPKEGQWYNSKFMQFTHPMCDQDLYSNHVLPYFPPINYIEQKMLPNPAKWINYGHRSKTWSIARQKKMKKDMVDIKNEWRKELKQVITDEILHRAMQQALWFSKHCITTDSFFITNKVLNYTQLI